MQYKSMIEYSTDTINMLAHFNIENLIEMNFFNENKTRKGKVARIFFKNVYTLQTGQICCLSHTHYKYKIKHQFFFW